MKKTLKTAAVAAITGAALLTTLPAQAFWGPFDWFDDDDYYGPWGPYGYGGPWGYPGWGYPGYGYGYPAYGYGYPAYGYGYGYPGHYGYGYPYAAPAAPATAAPSE
ncbi:MAG: hypothetical protein AB2632_11225 [Candidatus Thiodiazotropha sp.]